MPRPSEIEELGRGDDQEIARTDENSGDRVKQAFADDNVDVSGDGG